MPDVSFTALLLVCAVAVLAPLLLGLAPRWRIPAVVLEIVAGVLLGPSGLGWLHVDLPVQIAALLGLAFLLFLAGLEIDLAALRGRTLGLAVGGYGLALVLGLAAGLGAHAAGAVRSPVLVAIALSATSLGLVIPVLKDAGALDSDAGRAAVAGATVADFAAILLLSLLFSASGASTPRRLLMLAAFVLLVVATAVLVLAVRHWAQLAAVLVRLQDSTAEIRVRLAVLLLVGFAVLAEQTGLESILGAFLAGALVAGVDRAAVSHPHFRLKLEAIGYGFLVPVYFVSSGARLDVSGLLADPAAWVAVPGYLLALLAVRGLPALLQLRALGVRPTIATGLLQATSLPFIVTATQIGVAAGLMSPLTATALVCAGLLSVLVFPVVAVSLLRPAERPATAEEAAVTG